MKRVNVIGSVLVDGKLRHQHENPIEVSAEEAKRLRDDGVLLDDPAAMSTATAQSDAAPASK